MKAGKMFWGIILVYLGLIVLLHNFNIIDFSWRVFWKFWPVILIIWGVEILIAKENSRRSAILVALITCLGLGMLTFFGINEYQKKRNYPWGNNTEDYRTEDDPESKTFIEEYNPEIKTGKLAISGGAGDFEIKRVTDKLLVAHIDEGNINYVLKRTDSDSSVNLNLHARQEKGITFPTNRVHDTKILLNENPVWDIDVKVGAADVNFDFRPFKVRNLTLSGGAADVKIRFGSLSEYQNVVVETGVSSVELKVPKSVGCKIKNQSGLSSKTFENFNSKGSGVYETSNYSTAEKKIEIFLKTGISDVTVKTYQD